MFGISVIFSICIISFSKSCPFFPDPLASLHGSILWLLQTWWYLHINQCFSCFFFFFFIKKKAKTKTINQCFLMKTINQRFLMKTINQRFLMFFPWLHFRVILDPWMWNMSDFVFSFQTRIIFSWHWAWMNPKAQLQNETGVLVMFSVHRLIKNVE